MTFREVARSIVMQLNDRKWYEIEDAIVLALEEAAAGAGNGTVYFIPSGQVPVFSIDHWRRDYGPMGQADGDA